MVVRAYDYYEADIKDIEEVKHPFAYMLRGISRAFMDLAYGINYIQMDLGNLSVSKEKL